MTTHAAAPFVGGGPCDGDEHTGPVFEPVKIMREPTIGGAHRGAGHYRYDMSANGEYVYMGQVK